MDSPSSGSGIAAGCGACCRVLVHLRDTTTPSSVVVTSAHDVCRAASHSVTLYGATLEIRRYPKNENNKPTKNGASSIDWMQILDIAKRSCIDTAVLEEGRDKEAFKMPLSVRAQALEEKTSST